MAEDVFMEDGEAMEQDRLMDQMFTKFKEHRVTDPNAPDTVPFPIAKEATWYQRRFHLNAEPRIALDLRPLEHPPAHTRLAST